MRRLSAVALVLMAIGILLAVVSPAGAQGDGEDNSGTSSEPGVDAGVIDIVEVNGLFDEVLADHVITAIDASERAGQTRKTIGLVFQIDSEGSVIDDAALAAVAERIDAAEIPIAFWVGPSGASAKGGAVELIAIADRVGVAIGSDVGDMGSQRLSEERFGTLFPDPATSLANRTIGHEQAETYGWIGGRPAATLGDFLIDMPGVQIEEVTQGDEIRRQMVTQVRFSQLSIIEQLMHTVASPPIAYLLITIGLALFVFELFTAGVGVAGFVGVICSVLGCYGLAALPTRTIGLVLLFGAFIAFAVDVQTNIPRFWTAAGMVMFIVGTLTLFRGLWIGWVPVIVGIGGIALTFFSGMPSMVRTRFSTPTIGREWMIGEMGEAVGDVDPNGTVRIRDVPWKAYTNRATPIHAGERVRVAGIEGLVLEVEPEEGAARDYREMRGSRSAAAPTDDLVDIATESETTTGQ